MTMELIHYDDDDETNILSPTNWRKVISYGHKSDSLLVAGGVCGVCTGTFITTIGVDIKITRRIQMMNFRSWFCLML